MATNRVKGEHVEVSPGIAGGRPRIAGHRVRVQDVVVWHDLLGMSPEEIITRCPGLGLADVYAALAYYHDHADEIRRYMEEDEALADALKAQTASKLAQKLSASDGGDDPLSQDLATWLEGAEDLALIEERRRGPWVEWADVRDKL
jgi:uncharacterized protein (DUF433 family)